MTIVAIADPPTIVPFPKSMIIQPITPAVPNLPAFLMIRKKAPMAAEQKFLLVRAI